MTVAQQEKLAPGKAYVIPNEDVTVHETLGIHIPIASLQGTSVASGIDYTANSDGIYNEMKRKARMGTLFLVSMIDINRVESPHAKMKFVSLNPDKLIARITKVTREKTPHGCVVSGYFDFLDTEIGKLWKPLLISGENRIVLSIFSSITTNDSKNGALPFKTVSEVIAIALDFAEE